MQVQRSSSWHSKHFGDVAPNTLEPGKPSDNRYIFVTTSWEAARAAIYNDTSGTGEKSSKDLNARFANWFYFVASPDYQKLRLKRKRHSAIVWELRSSVHLSGGQPT